MIDQLYDLIGGRKTLWAATETFYRRVLADDTLRSFFEGYRSGATTRRTKHVHLHASRWTNRLYRQNIAAAHARAAGLNEGHFDSFLKHFREALNEVGVQVDKVEKVVKLLESRRSAVLNP